MKKSLKKIFIIFISFFIFTLTASAENDYFDFVFENSKEKILNEEKEYIRMTDNNYDYQDGYVTSHITLRPNPKTEDEAVLITALSYYDSTGKEITKKELENTIVLSLKSNDKDLYALVIKPNDACIEQENLNLDNFSLNNVLETLDETCQTTLFRLVRMNEKLEEKAYVDINIGENTSGSIFIGELILQEVGKILGYDTITINDDKISIFTLTGGVIEVDKSFTSATRVEMTEIADLKKYYPEIGLEFENIEKLITDIQPLFQTENEEELIKLLAEMTPRTIPVSVDFNNKYKITSGLEFNTNIDERPSENYPLNIMLGNEEESQLFFSAAGVLTLTDNENNLIWEKQSSDYMAYLNTHIINNYIVTIGVNIKIPEDIIMTGEVNESNLKINTDILIFDYNGNLLQKISDNSVHLGLFPTKKGFITANIGINSLLDLDLTSSNKVYIMNNRIESKVEGKGSIKVDKASQPGEEITLDIKPEKGYEVGTIQVIDYNGNVIEVKSNKFIMPSSDVTILTTFVVANPNTKAISIISIIILCITCGIIAIKYQKKIKWIKG